jgi:hypothetical protein
MSIVLARLRVQHVYRKPIKIKMQGDQNQKQHDFKFMAESPVSKPYNSEAM